MMIIKVLNILFFYFFYMQHIVATLEGNFISAEEAHRISSRIMRFAKIKGMKVTTLDNISHNEPAETPAGINKSSVDAQIPRCAQPEHAEEHAEEKPAEQQKSTTVEFRKSPIAHNAEM